MKKRPELREKLTNTIRWLIAKKGVDKFLFGSKSSFDDFCREVVNQLREEYPYIRRVCVRMYYPELGEPYLGYILRDFENTCVPKGVENAGVARCIEHNQAMINTSDYCIFYITMIINRHGENIPSVRWGIINRKAEQCLRMNMQIVVYGIVKTNNNQYIR